MNAITENGEEEFLERQAPLLEDMVEQNKIPNGRIISYIMEQAPFLRLFVANLPDDLKECWERAEKDEEARAEVEKRYEEFRNSIGTLIAGRFDPETETALMDAIETGNVKTANSILEAHITLSEETKGG